MRIGLMMGALVEPILNAHLLDSARRYGGEGAQIEHLRIVDLPAYVPVPVDAALPTQVAQFHEHLLAVDGLVIFATQHLGGVTGAVKNALDWMDLPGEVMRHKPVALAGVTSTGVSVFAALQQVRSALSALGATVMKQPEYILTIEPEAFSHHGLIEDVELADDLSSFLTAARGYVAHELRASVTDSSIVLANPHRLRA